SRRARRARWRSQCPASHRALAGPSHIRDRRAPPPTADRLPAPCRTRALPTATPLPRPAPRRTPPTAPPIARLSAAPARRVPLAPVRAVPPTPAPIVMRLPPLSDRPVRATARASSSDRRRPATVEAPARADPQPAPTRAPRSTPAGEREHPAALPAHLLPARYQRFVPGGEFPVRRRSQPASASRTPAAPAWMLS